MRKLSILVVMLGVLWLGATAGAGAWAADDSPVAQTTVSTRDVTPKGEPLQRRDRTEARAVPDRTNLVSVTWKGDPSAAFRVETRSTDGQWIDRGEVSQAVDLPDAGTADARRVAATTSGIASDPILVKSPDEVRLRLADGIATDVDVTAFAPTAPPGLLPISQTAAMVPGIGLIGVGGAIAALRSRRRSIAVLVIVVVVAGGLSASITERADAAAPGNVPWPAQPPIVTRAQLGINESLRLNACPEGPDYAAPKHSIIHHTVNSNSYSQAGAADIVRNLYSYFLSIGYCDQAYNFLVDKYGTIYEGRYGGIDQGVVGAHAYSFNTSTIGVAMIGDHTNVAPSGATVSSISNLLAWKFTIHNINPNAQVPTHGTTVDPVVGHRNVGAISGNTTSCPGNAGYTILDQVRNNVRPRVAFGWPWGAVDIADRTLGGARVAGWSVDPDVADPIQVHIYVDGQIAAATWAGGTRPDIGAAYPGYGSNHGFDTVVPMSPGPHTVCAWGISVANGDNGLLGCRAVRDTPVGAIDIARPEGGPLHLAGWTVDPASTASLPVHVYVDGVGVAILTANVSRPDIGAAFPGYGPAHGFDTTIPMSNGDHTVCVYAINAASTAVGVLGCRTISGATLGTVDLARREGGPAHLTGWTLDLDTAASIPIHVYVDGVGAAITTANTTRTDVGSAFVGYGNSHGFDVTVPLAPGAHTVCVYGIGVGPNPVTALGYRSIPGAPIGSLDAVGVVGGAVHAQGWAIDLSTAAPSVVHIYADGVGVAILTTDLSRPDIDAAFPGYGATHGFDVTLPISQTGHTVCAYAIGASPGGNALIGCRSI